MNTRTPILPRPSRLLISLLFVSLLTLGACTPLPGPAVELTPSLQPVAPTPDLLTGASGVGGAPETPADAAAGLPIGQAFVDLSSNGAAVPHWVLSASEVEHLKTLLDRLPPAECPSLTEPTGYRGIVVVLGAGDQGVRHAYGGWVWLGSPAAMNPQTTCQLDSGREVERFLLSSAQPYLDPQVFNALTAGLALPVPTPLVTPAATPTLAPGFLRDADEGFGVQFARPGNWELCQGTGLSRIYCVAGPPTENPIAPPVFYFTLLPPGFMNEDASAYNWWSPEELAAAFAVGAGEQFTSPRVPAGYEQYFTYTRRADTTVDGLSAVVVENERPWGIAAGTKDRRVLIKLGAGALVLGTYYATDSELRIFEEVVASFRIGTMLRARAAQP